MNDDKMKIENNNIKRNIIYSAYIANLNKLVRKEKITNSEYEKIKRKIEKI